MSFYCSPLAGTSLCCSMTLSMSVLLFIFPLLTVVKFKVNIVSWSFTVRSQWANGPSLLAIRKREKQWERVRVCVCAHSCLLVCLVQNWFKAPGHRKKGTLHSRHVLETSSRGSTIAIQQCRLQTPKWVCSVLQCPTWQSATYSASVAPNIPSPSCCYFSILTSSSSFFFLPHSLNHPNISTFILTSFSPSHSCIPYMSMHFTLLSPFLYIHNPSYTVQLLCSDWILSFYCKVQERDAECDKACRCVDLTECETFSLKSFISSMFHIQWLHITCSVI